MAESTTTYADIWHVRKMFLDFLRISHGNLLYSDTIGIPEFQTSHFVVVAHGQDVEAQVMKLEPGPLREGILSSLNQFVLTAETAAESSLDSAADFEADRVKCAEEWRRSVQYLLSDIKGTELAAVAGGNALSAEQLQMKTDAEKLLS